VHRAVGIVPVFIGLLTFFVGFPLAIQYSLALAMISSLPALYMVLFGCSLLFGSGFRRAVEQCMLLTVIIVLPSIFFLPLIYQIVSSALLVTVFIAVLLWYRRRPSSQPKIEKEKGQT
jgi:hypothetical protein